MGLSGQIRYQGVLIRPYTLLSPSPQETLFPQYGMYVGMSIGKIIILIIKFVSI